MRRFSMHFLTPSLLGGAGRFSTLMSSGWPIDTIMVLLWLNVNWSVSLLENDKICIILPSLWVILIYTRIAFLNIIQELCISPYLLGENGTVILVGCNSPFCENCFSLRFRDFSKSRSNENYFSQTFSRLKASSRKIKAWRLRLAARTARLTARTAPSNGPDGPSNGPDGPPNGPDGGAGDRRLRPD